MTQIHVSGPAADAVARTVPRLVEDLVASGVLAQNPDLWGPEAADEARVRLGWTDAVSVSRPLIEEILQLREELQGDGVEHIVLAGMGGSSLAPELITKTANVDLTVLDSTHPDQVRAALADRLPATALVVSSKSGSTVETDSQRRAYEQAFRDAGIDPARRIVVVTDPGSPFEELARDHGYRCFTADANVGGRYSALTAFGLVPSGLAGVDIAELLDEAEAVMLELAVDAPANPGLVLAAAIAATEPRRDKLGIVPDGTHLHGFADWAEQLIAESTGKEGTGILPVVLDPLSPELNGTMTDLQVVRLVDDIEATHLFTPEREGEIVVTGSLGSQLLVWEFAVAVAGRILGINPFDQPDVESAKVAARSLLDNPPEPVDPTFVEGGIEVRGSAAAGFSDLEAAVTALFDQVSDEGYLAVQGYVDRTSLSQLGGVRDLIAERIQRPVTFGWGPRFLHSTGQYHKGGPAEGVFLQISQQPAQDLAIPGREFTFGELIAAQASGDATVLHEHGRPVLSLTLPAGVNDLTPLFAALGYEA